MVRHDSILCYKRSALLNRPVKVVQFSLNGKFLLGACASDFYLWEIVSDISHIFLLGFSLISCIQRLYICLPQDSGLLLREHKQLKQRSQVRDVSFEPRDGRDIEITSLSLEGENRLLTVCGLDCWPSVLLRILGFF